MHKHSTMSLKLSTFFSFIVISASIIPVAITYPEDRISNLTLSEAVRLVLANNPLLKAKAAGINETEGALLQAGIMPNPEFGTEVENFAGQGENAGFRSAETTIYLSQLIEFGSKRTKRQKVASIEREIAYEEFEAARIQILSDTASAFINVLAAQELSDLNDELVKLARQSADTIGEKVEAGKISPVERARALVELASAQNELMRARNDLATARIRLAAFWNGGTSAFSKASGDLTAIVPPPDEDELCSLIPESPEIARFSHEMARSQAELELERANAVPDITVSAGIRNFQETDNNAFVMGISIPIPLFDRNQGGVQEAAARLERKRHMYSMALSNATAALRSRLSELSWTYRQAVMLRDSILPGAKTAFEATHEGYMAGKFSFMQFLDAQRTFFNVKRQYIEALRNYHLTRTELERIAGTTLKGIETCSSE